MSKTLKYGIKLDLPLRIQVFPKKGISPTWWFKVPFLGWLSDPFKWLSDLQLGNEKVTLNHLVYYYSKDGIGTLNPNLRRSLDS